MSKEIALLKARIADRKKVIKDAERRAESYIIILRDTIDPYEEDFTELDLERASVTMKDFLKLYRETKTNKEQLARMEKDLNG